MNVVALFLAAVVAAPADFDTEVLPVLTRAGCNAGACHGAAAGRGGFKLSLFGGDPAADYRAIVHEFEGRRVNLARPERSLLLLKPTWELDHEGGQRFESDSEFAQFLTKWIAAGAPRGQGARLINLAIDPPQVVVPAVPAEVNLTITASFAGKTPATLTRRIEKLAVVTPADPASVEVIGDGKIRLLRPGRHAVVVRFLTQVVALQVTAPHSNPPLDAKKLPANNWIDEEVNAALVALRLPPSPRADESTLLRRVTLDLTGRLPTSERIREYLADDSENKFAGEVNRLLASREYAEYWTYKFARWLQVQAFPNDAEGTKTYHAWLRQQIEGGRPVHEWMAELITADGDSHEHGPANFHRSAADARGEAEHLTESLLGIRLRCANCHNHPLDRWTQDDYHGLAAIFARLERGPKVRLKTSGEVLHPATGEAAVPRIPGERDLPAEGDGRPDLAQWLASPGNRRLATAQVNRLWQAMFGRGLIEPVDDLRDTNPATHPELLARLADDFVASGYRLRHTLRLLALSAAYQRSSQPLPAAPREGRFYAHSLVRPLPPEVLLDAVSDVLGVPLAFDEVPPGTRAIGLYSPHLARSVLGPLAGCGRAGECPSGSPPAASLDQLAVQLHWINGPLLNERLANSSSVLARLASDAGAQDVRPTIDAFYLRILARYPTEAERKFWQKELEGGQFASRWQDFAWTLLSTRDFVANH
jgi:hypothetical protein